MNQFISCIPKEFDVVGVANLKLGFGSRENLLNLVNINYPYGDLRDFSIDNFLMGKWNFQLPTSPYKSEFEYSESVRQHLNRTKQKVIDLFNFIFPFYVILEPKKAMSQLVPSVPVSKYQWTVTPLVIEGRCDQHAVGAIEGLDENGNYFCEYIHYVGPVVEIKNEPVTELKNKIKVWGEMRKRSADQVKIMIEAVKLDMQRNASETQRRGHKFSYLGRHSVFNWNFSKFLEWRGDNCFTWLEKND